MRFDWKAFENRRNHIAVHCKTEEEAIEFCNEMKNRGMKWCSGRSYSLTQYNMYNERTCYSNKGEYCSIEFYEKEEDFTILEWSDFKDFTLADLKPCMVVKIRDGRLALVVERKDGLAISKLEDVSQGLIGLKRFDNALLVAKEKNSDYDIMIVYDFSDSCDITLINDRKILYQRIEKSPTQIKLEELETKQREIADEMAQLRKEME